MSGASGPLRDGSTFVIVGAGLAGAKTAESLRAWGFGGRLVLIGEEPVRPYERPPLSKDYLRGETSFSDLAVHDADYYQKHGIELLSSTTATGIDLRGHRVTVDPGDDLLYDRLLLAPGAAPRTLPVTGADLAGVHTLRTVADADAIRQASQSSSSAVVVGAGFVGSEVAAALRQCGLQVAIVDPGATPMERVLGPAVGRAWAELHAEHGVELHLGTRVESLTGTGRVEAVRLSDGTVLTCDLVVIGVGVLPRSELAAAAGLTVADGIVVDQHLETSVPGVFAAGDVASAYHPVLRSRVRVEHWLSALTQAPTAAANMLGHRAVHDWIPWFASPQYDLDMEYAGHASGSDEVVIRGSLSDRQFIAFWLRNGRVRAGLSANVPGATRYIKALVSCSLPVDARDLSDPAVELRDLASSVVRLAAGQPLKVSSQPNT
ncbi:MAG TPA: FAD-dependent oxidoreductase [Candidatus Saccharimonadales bacterium]|nr:FAD-dependent oxidoreductase [Candidatus Saccharimonadales bacterium]